MMYCNVDWYIIVFCCFVDGEEWVDGVIMLGIINNYWIDFFWVG